MKKMKLSEAILKGCEKSKKYSNEYFSDDGRRACALGAAYLAVYRTVRGCTDDKLSDRFPILLETVNGNTVFGTVLHRNDKDGWSRQRIAKWVAKLEKKLEAQ